MGARTLALLFACITGASLSGLLSFRVYAQTTGKPAYDWKASFAQVKVGKVPRTPDGKPDLQGIWSFSILTPLERPNGLQKERLTTADAENAEVDAQERQKNLRTEPTNTPPGQKTTDAYNTFWRDGYWYKAPMTTLHTSQVVDPPDGRLPPLTAFARERLQDFDTKLNRAATGPEDRPTTSRCLRGLTSGPPFLGQLPGSQETTLQIVENPGVVVVRGEGMHDAQLIYLDGRPRPPDTVHLDKGASRGRWEGDTLVVESTNFADDSNGFFATYGTTNKMHLIERWKRLDDTHLLYGFTVDDPETWTKPWSAEYVMWRLTDQEQLVEYACHEGNVGIEFTLSAARAKERREADAKERAEAKAIEAAEARPSAIPPTAELASRVTPGAISSNSLGMQFVMIPPGQFQMGCSEGAKAVECTDDERPRHEVQITKAFELGKTEVTEKVWHIVMGTNPSAYKGEDLPVENVTFEQVQDFIGKLNASNDGYVYRLPTEAEWEYAARAGTHDPYSGAVLKDALARFAPADELAWYNVDQTHPVATKKANGWGVYDMRGNVAEWVEDYYDPTYYSDSPVADPKGPPSGEARVVRGGSFHSYPWLTRVSLRSVFPETYEYYDLGFRVVREKK
jgi:formylglycine-generating enzyme required for sulfatase activity